MKPQFLLATFVTNATFFPVLSLMFAAMSQNPPLHRNHRAETLYVHDCMLTDLSREYSRLYDPKDSGERTREGDRLISRTRRLLL